MRARRWADDFDGPAGTLPAPRGGARRAPRAVVDDRPRRRTVLYRRSPVA